MFTRSPLNGSSHSVGHPKWIKRYEPAELDFLALAIGSLSNLVGGRSAELRVEHCWSKDSRLSGFTADSSSTPFGAAGPGGEDAAK